MAEFEGKINPPEAEWVDIPSIGTGMPLRGGSNGIGPMNQQAMAIAKRINYLNEEKVNTADLADDTDPNKGAAMVGRNVIAVDSIADLLALPPGVRRGDLRYLVKSYHAGSDVGGGEFYWDEASTADDNGGTVFAVSGVVAGRFVRRFDGPLHVRWFGAVGDGVADDTDAIHAALLHSRDTGVRPFVPAGTYMVRTATITVDASADGQVVGLVGEGEASVIKVFDGEITSRFRQTFLFRHRDYEDMVVHFSNLLLDNNARGSPPPSTPFEFEQSHAFQHVGSGTGSFAHVFYENVVINDPAADGFQCASYRCKKYSVINCEVRNRTRMRSDIQFSVAPETWVINGFKGTRIELEPVGPTPVPIRGFLSNIEVDQLDYGIGSAQPEGSVVFMDNVHVKVWTYLTGVQYKVTNCVLHIGDIFDGRWGNLRPGSTISDSDIVLHYDEENNWVYGLDARSCDVDFYNVRFLIDSDDPEILPVLRPGTERLGLLGDLSTSSVGNPERVKKVVNCWFDHRAYTSVTPYRNGTWYLKDNDYAGLVSAINNVGATVNRQSKVIVDGGDFSRVTGEAISTFLNHGDPVRLVGEHRGHAATNVGMVSGSILNVSLISTRRIPISDDHVFGSAFKGDIYILENPSEGMPSAWICTRASVSNATFRMYAQAGVKVGSTSERPSLTDRDAGCQYIDTDLSTAGTPIWWTGTTWVDATGTVV